MDYFEILMAQKLSGGGGGGGGSGDASIAKMTVTVSNHAALQIIGAVGMTQEGESASMGQMGVTESGTVDILLYKGKACVELANIAMGGSDPVVSGNVIELGEGAYFVIGDCSVVVS